MTFFFEFSHKLQGIQFREAVFHQKGISIIIFPPDGPHRFVCLFHESFGPLVSKAFVDPELGNEAFTYGLDDGREDSVHVDEILEYNKDPNYMRDMLLYRLTLEVQERLKESRLSRREIIRRLGTSASQFYRLLDQTYYEKSVDQMFALLTVLGCRVNVTVEHNKKDGITDLGPQKAANP